MGKSKKETIEMPITEAPKEAGEDVEKKNLKKKMVELRNYEGPRYMQANTWLRRYIRLTINTTSINTITITNTIIKTIINIDTSFCFDWCCTDLNRPWPPMAETQVRSQ